MALKAMFGASVARQFFFAENHKKEYTFTTNHVRRYSSSDGDATVIYKKLILRAKVIHLAWKTGPRVRLAKSGGQNPSIIARQLRNNNFWSVLISLDGETVIVTMTRRLYILYKLLPVGQ